MRPLVGALCIALAPAAAQAARPTERCERAEAARALIAEIAPAAPQPAPIDLPETLRAALEDWAARRAAAG